MALIKCPECGQEISANSVSCFYCGCKIGENDLDLVQEDDCSTDEKTVPKGTRSLEYNKIGKKSIIVGCIFWIIGFFKIFIYNGGEEYSSNSINAYVGGDAYNLIINATYFAGLSVIGGTLIISGILVMIYAKLQEKSY
ncbi:hypothetical protein [Aminipila terrae]|uniref:Zinc ribbon domain-containing protein n=1 Tax=Aminipila terrae TaxID=2697030 RepID=A0A6P1MG29_9FIRM|nr:hypothetical protein [Aminipila terrae]QHI72691.1 hypothetical protein Ami3637_10040 [Aminipila terrae]